MGWKIIEIESANSINLFLNNLIIQKDNDKISISLNDIDVLLINNYKLKVTIQLINALTENNILTIICGNNYIPNSLILPIIGNYNTLKVLEQQLSWNKILKSNWWKSIIKQKILNQADLLKYLFNNDENLKLIELSNEIKDFDVSNREGHASKIYWHNLFGISFKRHNDDYINMLLNYGYTILRAYFARSIVKKGLDPRISLFHKSFHNHFALASDLMEPFRIIIDYHVYKIVELNNTNFYECKDDLINCFNKKILVNGKFNFINNAIDIFVDAFVNQATLPEIKIDYESL